MMAFSATYFLVWRSHILTDLGLIVYANEDIYNRLA